MQVSKYLYKHFAQLNCHNPKRNNFSITVKHHNYNNCYCLNWRTNKNGYIVFVGVCIV